MSSAAADDLLRSAIARIEKARLDYGAKHIVKFIAVSKYAGAAAIERLYERGQRAFGENKVQDLAAKSAALARLPIEWHFIGRIQSNKIAKLLALRPALIHSVASFDQAREIENRLEKSGLDQRALLQINSAGEAEKSGVLPDAAFDEYMAIFGHCRRLKLEGIMTIGANSDDKNEVIKSFKRAREVFERVPNARTLSMGMSGDYEEAISCGANLLRLGGVLFSGN